VVFTEVRRREKLVGIGSGFGDWGLPSSWRIVYYADPPQLRLAQRDRRGWVGLATWGKTGRKSSRKVSKRVDDSKTSGYD